MDFSIGAISIAALIFGIVEAAKEFGLSGKACRFTVLALGTIFVGLSYAIQQALIPEPWLVWIELIVTALAGGLAAMGYYDFLKKRGNGGSV